MNKTQQPLVSIFMPVYNSERFLLETYKSIQQQSYTNWELIAVDDWSTDYSWKLLEKIAQKDKRVTIYRNGRHRGVAGAANLALKRAKGSYVARMDADDLMHPQRLAKQVQFMETHPDVVVVGTQCKLINADGKKIGSKTFPVKHEAIYRMIFKSIPIQQPSMMVNVQKLPRGYRWYKDSQQTAEEVDFIFRVFEMGKCANLPQQLLAYRIHGKNTSLMDPKKTFYQTVRSRFKAIRDYGYQPCMIDVLVTLAQVVVVTLLPKAWIYPVYRFIRSFSVTNIKQICLSAVKRWHNGSRYSLITRVQYAFNLLSEKE